MRWVGNLLDRLFFSLGPKGRRWLTVYHWGFDLRVGRQWLVLVWRGEKRCYLSPTGTPNAASRFFWGRA